VFDYHIIGDIHGQADKLERLLRHLGYQEQNGVYQHPSAQVVFLGDFIDRGHQQRRVIDIVRQMVDQGHALAVMGNHEFNAICYHTLHPETADPLRPHSKKNTDQHEAFLEDYALHDEETKELINWFKKLPVYLEVKDAAGDQVLFRAVHACWSQAIIDRTLSLLTDEYIIVAAGKGNLAYEDIEVLLKGPEIPLPGGVSFFDKDKNVRHNIRIKWWSSSDNSTYQDIAMVPEGEEENLPTDPIPATQNEYIYPKDAPPVFFGHYWLTEKPQVIRHNLACLDYSAGKDGALVAYHWLSDGAEDKNLENCHFDFV
jgi:hypothetical protein